jgi:mitochondrial fission protein ELM1
MTASPTPSPNAASVSASSTERDRGAASAEARAIRESLETVILSPRPDVPRSDRPPVEIFLGTEPAQYRANRVFVYSIEKVRDPRREVRIHLMSQMPGFNRRFWTTGFTNYRFALPALAGGVGRAIYNDEDQIYLTDPGVLFDLAMEGAGILSISDTESSVMLVDCERMADVWTLDGAQNGWKRDLLRAASKDTGLRGDLDPGWNARDEEFKPGQSHLLHYTTLHTQPWRPFPERFVYQKGSHTELWHDLEREAVESGFELFRRDAPSRVLTAHLDRLRELPRSEMTSGIGVSGELVDAVDELCRRSKAQSILELAPDLRGDGDQRPGRFGLEVERRTGLLEFLGGIDVEERVDGVVCVDGLEALPVWDIPWIVEALFERAKGFVFAAVRSPESAPRRRFLFPPAGTTHTPEWWRSHFEAASRRHPEISWTLMTARGNAFSPDRIQLRRGGPRLDSTPPRVWTLTDGEPGNETQVSALAAALGWPYEARRPRLGPLASLPFMGQGAHLRGLEGLSSEADALDPPWPELLIVAGRRVAPVARFVRQASRGRTLVVALGAKAATPADQVDLAVTPRGATLFPHPHRFEVDHPLVPHRPRPILNQKWRDKIQSTSGRRLVLLIGSGTRRLGLDRAGAERLGRLVAESASGLGASVLIAASRHVDAAVLEGCLRGVGKPALVHQATRDQRPHEQAWPALVESADLFVLAGLGEATLAEITATGRPVFLSPQRSYVRGLLARLRDGFVQSIVRRAQARPENDRGTARPQEGLELICAKLVEAGWVRPRRDVEALRGRMVRSGRARLLRGPIRAGDLDGFGRPPESEVLRVAKRVREMLGVADEERNSTESMGSEGQAS